MIERNGGYEDVVLAAAKRVGLSSVKEWEMYAVHYQDYNHPITKKVIAYRRKNGEL